MEAIATAKAKAEEAEKSQVTQELEDHKKDRETAKLDLGEATSMRTKEANEFAATKADAETNIAAMASAIPALEKGMGGAALLQIPAGACVKELMSSYQNMDPMDRRDMLAILESSDAEYAPGTGQILGILKQMKEEAESGGGKKV